jgi:hypothetical protein
VVTLPIAIQILRKSRMRRRARTDLCGQRSVNERPYRDSCAGPEVVALFQKRPMEESLPVATDVRRTVPVFLISRSCRKRAVVEFRGQREVNGAIGVPVMRSA